MPNGNKSYGSFMRNFTFGVEDSLVSTVGLLSGIASAGTAKNQILLTGVVLIFVEAFSMAVGSLLSEHSVQEYEQRAEVPLSGSVKGSVIMFFSYFLSGFIPLGPYLLLPTVRAFWVSIGFSLFSLFILGVLNSRLLKGKVLKHGFQMLLIGGLSIALGVAVGRLIAL